MDEKHNGKTAGRSGRLSPKTKKLKTPPHMAQITPKMAGKNATVRRSKAAARRSPVS